MKNLYTLLFPLLSIYPPSVMTVSVMGSVQINYWLQALFSSFVWVESKSSKNSIGRRFNSTRQRFESMNLIQITQTKDPYTLYCPFMPPSVMTVSVMAPAPPPPPFKALAQACKIGAWCKKERDRRRLCKSDRHSLSGTHKVEHFYMRQSRQV